LTRFFRRAGCNEEAASSKGETYENDRLQVSDDHVALLLVLTDLLSGRNPIRYVLKGRHDLRCRFLITAMLKQDCRARTAITSMKKGKTFWTKVNLRKGIRTSVVSLAMARSPDSIWKRLFTPSVQVAIGSIRWRRRKRAPSTVGDVTSGIRLIERLEIGGRR
jgi:hypothetical protein